MNYFVTAFSNHAISAETLGLNDQANAFKKMAGEQQDYIDQFITYSKLNLFPKYV